MCVSRSVGVCDTHVVSLSRRSGAVAVVIVGTRNMGGIATRVRAWYERGRPPSGRGDYRAASVGPKACDFAGYSVLSVVNRGLVLPGRTVRSAQQSVLGCRPRTLSAVYVAVARAVRTRRLVAPVSAKIALRWSWTVWSEMDVRWATGRFVAEDSGDYGRCGVDNGIVRLFAEVVMVMGPVRRGLSP